MTMTPFHRPTRLLAALLLAGIICLGSQYFGISWHPSYISQQIPAEYSPGVSDATIDPISLVTSTEATIPIPPGFIEDAHLLPTADSFLTHFKAITKLPGMKMAEAKSGCNWPTDTKVNFQYAEDSEWVMQDRKDEELEMRRKQWQDFVNDELMPYRPYKDKFDGRGIVVVAGHEKSIKRVRVLLRALERLGSQIPVEIHYWAHEINGTLREDLASMRPKMFFNDLSAPSNIFKTAYNYNFNNYQLKTAAVMNSRFAEPLLLDSDNIPVIDPESLYESSTYKEYGTLFWPDIARTRPNNPMWAITDTACRMDEFEQESGQMIVDKRRFFYHLQLAAWFNNKHPTYYNQFLLGDKDMFRFAWHALKTKYGFPGKWLTSVGTLSDGYYCGHSFAQHHPNGSIVLMHGGLLKMITKQAMTWLRESRGGIFQAYKRSEYDEKHEVSVDVGIKWDAALYLPNRPADLPISSCTDIYDVSPQPLDDLLPGFEKVYEDIGGYWMLED